jgi:hypothetical protein
MDCNGVKVISVSYHESGLRTVSVRCKYCNTIHELAWATGVLALSEGLPCGVYARGIQIPAWALNLRKRTRDRFDPAQQHQVSAGHDRDNNAMDVPQPNWEE